MLSMQKDWIQFPAPEEKNKNNMLNEFLKELVYLNLPSSLTQ